MMWDGFLRHSVHEVEPTCGRVDMAECVAETVSGKCCSGVADRDAVCADDFGVSRSIGRSSRKLHRPSLACCPAPVLVAAEL